MDSVVERTPQQVGKCGELFVQYQLLKHGTESSEMTTDTGIDLVAFDTTKQAVVTIQVKTSTHREGDGSKWVAWDKGEQLVAQYIALVDLERDNCWLFNKADFERHATGSEGRWLWWYVPGHRPERTLIKRSEEDFSGFELHRVIPTLFSQ